MTLIQWTDRTWNPATGCNKVSPGCKNCYAAGVAHRFWGDRAFTDVEFHRDRLDQPYKWRNPQRVFVNSMSDFFHEAINLDDLCDAWDTMISTPRHSYQILTKRPERMRDIVPSIAAEMRARKGIDGPPIDAKPPDNIWLGVSVEDQIRTSRIPHLLDTPAAVRFLSCEPLLEPISFTIPSTILDGTEEVPSRTNLLTGVTNGLTPSLHMGDIDWVIIGGESGPGARPCHVEWIHSIVRQCRTAGVAVFVKQTGSNCWLNGKRIKIQGSKKGGDEEWLASLGLLIREFPTL